MKFFFFIKFKLYSDYEYLAIVCFALNKLHLKAPPGKELSAPTIY